MKTVKTVKDVSDYVQEMAPRFEHHAVNLTAAWQVILTAVVRYADGGVFRVATRKDHYGNGAWVRLGGHKYALRAERIAPHNYWIVLKRGSARGPVVAIFTETTAPDTIHAALAAASTT